MIEIKDLTKRYGNKTAVDNISFTVKDGEIVGFLGPNGAGKSTTMNILTGYLSSTAGTAVIDGHDILDDALEAKKLIGYLPEQPPLYGDMTVLEYLEFVYDLKKCRLPKKQHLAEVCDVVKLSDVRHRLIRNLSKGYKQRVGIAQAIVGNPKTIILDEPTIGLDPKQVIEVRNLIRTLGREHTVILSTHILSEVQAVCERVIILSEGRIVADEKTELLSRVVEGTQRFKVQISGPQKEIYAMLSTNPTIASVITTGEREGDTQTYLIESREGVDIRKNLFFALAQKGWPIMSLVPTGMNLEEVFIRLTDKPASSARRRGSK